MNKHQTDVDFGKGLILVKEPFPLCDSCGKEKTLCEEVDTGNLAWYCEGCELVD